MKNKIIALFCLFAFAAPAMAQDASAPTTVPAISGTAAPASPVATPVAAPAAPVLKGAHVHKPKLAVAPHAMTKDDAEKLCRVSSRGDKAAYQTCIEKKQPEIGIRVSEHNQRLLAFAKAHPGLYKQPAAQ